MTEIVLDRFYTVSDLHLGGKERARQICGDGPLLAAAIDSMARDDGASTGLLLNGDVIDFLIEAPSRRYFQSEAEAVAIVEALASDPAFGDVFAALRRFTRKGGHLAIAIGNHDLELFYPRVREAIERRTGPVYWVVPDLPHRVRVGEEIVHCEHGHTADPWNDVDPNDLMRAARDPRFAAAWRPNRGTELVVDGFNRYKRDYPFIDLLKPEIGHSLPVALKTLRGRPWAALVMMGHFARGLLYTAPLKLLLGDEPGPEVHDAMQYVSALLSERGTPEEWLAQAEEDAARGSSAVSWHDAGNHTLGAVALPLVAPLAQIDAFACDFLLKRLQRDRSFELDGPDEFFTEIGGLERVQGARFVVAGHTHLRRCLPIPGDVPRVYYNTGTWMRVVRLRERHLASTEVFHSVLDDLLAADLTLIDGSKHGLIAREDMSTIAAFERVDGGTRGQLLRACAPEAAGMPPWVVVEGTTHVFSSSRGD